jgi:hypothetical protein
MEGLAIDFPVVRFMWMLVGEADQSGDHIGLTNGSEDLLFWLALGLA